MKRLAKQADFDAVYSIYMDDLVVPYLTYDPMPKEDFRPIFQELLDSNSFFVYEVDSEIVGFIKIVLYPATRVSHRAHIDTLAFHPSHHGKGLADKLIRKFINELQITGIKRIDLIVESDNIKGIRFYQKLGFQIEGTLKKFYKRASDDHYVDDHIMAILLD